MKQLELSDQVLTRPIPDQTAAIAARAGGYDDIPAAPRHRLYNNPLVELSGYGIAGVSYYARKNVTGDPIPGVSPIVLVRKDTAERLDRVNSFVRSCEWLKRFAGGEVELRVDEGLRSQALQEYVSVVHYPEFLRNKLEQQKGESDKEFEARVQEGAAKSVSKAQTPPHATGGVVDLRLIRTDGDNSMVGYGNNHANRDTIHTDYYEKNTGDENAERYAKVRRIVYHTLAAVGGVVNPLEPWHYGFIDVKNRRYVTDGLTAKTTGAKFRFYDSVPGMPDADPSLTNELETVKKEQARHD